MLRVWPVVALLLIASILSACGGGGQAGASLDQARLPGSPLLTAGGLPSMSDLPIPSHGVSVTGPGWYQIDPDDPSMRIAESGNNHPGDGVLLEADGAPAWVVFALRGFDGDCFPTSARIDIDLLEGGYYLGFSDYTAGNWEFSGEYYNDATSQLEHVGEYYDPNTFISEDGVFYLMVIVEDGSRVGLNLVEVGVDGGSAGPAPPGYILGFDPTTALGGTAGVLVRYHHSPDYRAPDFAGYHIERAPIDSGEFTRLTADPVRTSMYLDETAEYPSVTSYRVAAVDTSGNLSSWLYFRGLCDEARSTAPFADLVLPQGDLTGAGPVRFDMSGSFDPMGVGITNYEIDTGHRGPAYSGPDESVELFLQPGCYRIVCSVTSDAGVSDTVHFFKVYPRWEPAPVVIAEPEELWPRSLQYRIAISPDTGDPVVFWYDNYLFGLMMIEQDLMPLRLPLESSSDIFLGDCLTVGDTIYVPISIGDTAGMAMYRGGEFGWLLYPSYRSAGTTVCSFVGHMGLPTMAFVEEPLLGGSDLVQFSPLGPGGSIAIDVDLNCVADATYNPDNGRVYVMYSTDGMTWCRTIDGLVSASLELAYDKQATVIDVEINPATGLPVCAYHFSNVIYYNEMNPDGTWPHPERITAGGNEGPNFDLVATDTGIFLSFAQVGAALRVYERVGAGWDEFSVIDYGGLFSGVSVSLAPTADGGFVLADLANDAQAYVTTISSDGSFTAEEFLSTTEFLGLDLTATTGVDDLHLAWQGVLGVDHFTCDLATYTWGVSPGMASGTKPQLLSDVHGDVLLTYVTGITGRTDHWDTGAWVNIDSAPISASCRPFATAQPFTDTVYWYFNDDDAIPEQLYTGRWREGAISTGDSDIEQSPIWAGTSFVAEFFDEIFAVAGGMTISNSSNGVYSTWPGWVEELWRNGISPPLDSTLIRGKLVDCSGFVRKTGDFPQQAYWLCYGPQGVPVRVSKTEIGHLEITLLEALPDDPFARFTEEQRRTATAALGHGMTAVGLICQLDGTKAWFEWDDFGEFEALDLPAELEYMSMPELVVDFNGRWHIIYRHFYTGEVLCWSTT